MSAGMPPPPAPPPLDPSGLSTGQRPPRPATVTIADLLLMLFALLTIVSVVVTAVVTPDLVDAMEEAFAGTDLEETAGFLGYSQLIGAVLFALFGLVIGILAIFNNQGRNGARITTWVLGGIALCCLGFGTLATAAGTTFNTSGEDVPSQKEVEEIVSQHVPDWVTPVSTVLGVVSMAALAVALLLLALPPSHPFFRKPTEQFIPPPDGGAYPPPAPPVG